MYSRFLFTVTAFMARIRFRRRVVKIIVTVRKDLCHRTHAFQQREGFHGAFLRRQFHGLAIRCLALPPDGRQLAGFEIGMPFQNPQCIATRNRSVLPGVAGQNDARIARAIEQPFHIVHPHRPGFIQHHQLTGRQHRFRQQQTLQRLRLEPLLAEHIRRRCRRRAKQRFNFHFGAGGDQLAQRRGFARASQTTQAGDPIMGAQHMINGALLIFAQPVGGFVCWMNRCNDIAGRIDRLN